MGSEVVFTGLKLDALPVRKQRRQGVLLSVQDVARLCGCGMSPVYCRVRRGMMPERVKVGRLLYWRASDLPAVREALAKKVVREKYRPPKTLTADEEKELLSLRRCGFKQRELAELFPLTQSQISRVLKRLECQQGR